MHDKLKSILNRIIFVLPFIISGPVYATAFVQCPGDSDGDAIIDSNNPKYDNVKCMHLAAGDGFINMADGKLQYIFGFSDMTGVAQDDAIEQGTLAAAFPAPTIVLNEGEEFYLTLTNVGMLMRPDLADPHTVHFHGFPNAGDIFDGLPDASISINMESSLSYYYNLVEPGTYMYHCHVEATEHMQMGMLGNLYVKPRQNGRVFSDPDGSGRQYNTFAYNDADGSTGYDVEYPIQIGAFDSDFHDASMNVQPLPFADMKANYGLLNGRGYPDTANPDSLEPPSENGGKISQPMSSLIEATIGQKILLRVSNLNVTNYFTLTAPGLTMKVVGSGARILRGKGFRQGKDLYYNTASITLGGGESADVLIDTRKIPAGRYFLYATELNYLNNNEEDYGGMMTEIVLAN